MSQEVIWAVTYNSQAMGGLRKFRLFLGSPFCLCTPILTQPKDESSALQWKKIKLDIHI